MPVVKVKEEEEEKPDVIIPVPPSSSKNLHGCYHILDFLWLGDMYTSKESAFLQKIGVRYILNAAHNLDNLFPDQFVYCNIAVQDQNATNIQRYFTESNAFLEQARREGAMVLVHCRGGVSRSATLVLAFIMWKLRLSYKKALKFLVERKPNVQPNPGFASQLVSYEKELRW
eukprot:TRINITY_DN2353_c0_g1_i3.p1 TRINITY_DN2353_c0_g1~~TRINITY_DN2353_c0_g1_i3.p1  ORF type:complete len:172 (-),score=33.80 TRINITY_DN2353_c0_g1_i3:167-682(-)